MIKERMSRMRDSGLFRRVSFVLVALATVTAFLAWLAWNAAAQNAGNIWTDTFADTSQIQTSADVVQVTDTGEFGTSFTPYAGNPLLSLESSDPWDADGDVTRQIVGALHGDVLYFPDSIDGYEFWMVFTPGPELTAYTPPVCPPGGSCYDYWWERPTLVRSHDGINWEKTDDYTNPIVNPGDFNVPEWDSYWLADPDVVYAPGAGPEEESWFVYYTGCSGTCANGVALSSDGKNYTKYAGNPVMPSYTRCPTVVYDETTATFHGWYNWGSYQVGYATSTNGVDWTPYNPTNPGQWGYIVYQATGEPYDVGGVSHMDVIYYGGQYWMYYLAMPTSQYAGLVIGLATSPDGINWTHHPDPIISPGETWDFWVDATATESDLVQSLYRPTVAIVDDTMYLYYGGLNQYSGWPPQDHIDMGLAFSSSTGPDGHIELEMGFDPAEYAPTTDTIAWYHMNEDLGGEPTYPGEYEPATATLAWYHLNEGTGSTALDVGGVINDNGTLDAPAWTTGLYGSGLSFDGNDRVTVPDSTELDPAQGITIEAWVNPSTDKENNYIVSKMNPGTSDYVYGLKLENTYTAHSEIGGLIRGTGGNVYFSYGGQIPVGTWTHVAMTYEMDETGSTQVRLYQNGTEVSYRYTDPIPAGTQIQANSGPLNVGVIPVSTPRYYVGVMDELRILGRALTAAEIAADGTILTPDTDVIDSSINGNHGSPVGGVTSTTGRFSRGLDFNGTTGYVEVPYSPSMNTADELTIEGWVNLDEIRDNSFFVSRAESWPPDHAAFGFKVDSAGLEGWIWHTDESHTGTDAYFKSESSLSPPVDEWAFVAMTYNSSERNIRLYLNGEEVPYSLQMEVPGDGRIDTPADVPILLGTMQLATGSLLPINGQLDEVRILSRALAPSEILADYGAGYRSSGELTSVLITPAADNIWDSFYAIDELLIGTGIEYSILDEGENVLLTSITSGTDISSLSSTPIRLHADLSTSAPISTPLLHEWSVSWQEDPTAVTLASFSATAAPGKVLLNWETAMELDNGGFNLYRSDTPEGEYIRLNGELIPSQAPGSLEGAVYSWEDREVELGHTYYYKLEAVDIHGVSTLYGPVSATLPARVTYSIYLPLVTKP
jgi:hypothetical protein